MFLNLIEIMVKYLHENTDLDGKGRIHEDE
jgi:hypothetical protein